MQPRGLDREAVPYPGDPEARERDGLIPVALSDCPSCGELFQRRQDLQGFYRYANDLPAKSLF